MTVYLNSVFELNVCKHFIDFFFYKFFLSVFLICVFWRGIGEEEEGESYKPERKCQSPLLVIQHLESPASVPRTPFPSVLIYARTQGPTQRNTGVRRGATAWAALDFLEHLRAPLRRLIPLPLPLSTTTTIIIINTPIQWLWSHPGLDHARGLDFTTVDYLTRTVMVGVAVVR